VSFPDGVLIVDKPEGPTSHDVVAVVRRSARGLKVGHTGTLDPLASGVLPIVLGKATRLAQFLSGADKEYLADIALGTSTTTFDRAGEVVDRRWPRHPSDLSQSDLDEALSVFRGNYLQQPPSFSAKKVDGDRAYDLARRNKDVSLAAVPVSVAALELVEWREPRLRVRLVCSAGFYVRSLADGLGAHLGTGAHLSRLVRTRSGDFGLDDAVTLADLDRDAAGVASRVIPLTRVLPALPALTLTERGARLAAKGGFIDFRHVEGRQAFPRAGRVRLMHPDGHLIAIAELRRSGQDGDPAVLHPGIVLE